MTHLHLSCSGVKLFETRPSSFPNLEMFVASRVLSRKFRIKRPREVWLREYFVTKQVF